MRARVRNLDLLAAVGVRIVMMLAQLFVVSLMCRSGQSAGSRLQIWDAKLYADLASHGYPHAVVIDGAGNLVEGTQFAFFPVYPALIRLVSAVTSLSSLDAGLVVAIVFSCALGPLTYVVTTGHGGSRSAGLLAVVLLGLLPMSIVFEMGYAESLFTALALAAFACAQRGRWGWASVALLLAGLTRPVGHVVALGVLVLGWQRWRADADRSRSGLVRVVGAAAMGCMGAPLMWAFAAVRGGHLTSWFDVQRAGWGTRFDGGAFTARFLRDQVFGPTDLREAAVCCAFVLLGWLAVVIATASTRLAPYAATAAAAWVTVVGSSNYWHSKPRLLLVAAVAVVPAACWLARQPRRLQVALVLVGALTSWWFGAYMVTQWPYAM